MGSGRERTDIEVLQTHWVRARGAPAGAIRVEQGQVGGLEAVAFLDLRAIDAQLATSLLMGVRRLGASGATGIVLGGVGSSWTTAGMT